MRPAADRRILLTLGYSLGPDLEDHALAVGAGQRIFGCGLELQVVHLPAAASLVQLLGPFWSFDDEHAAERMPLRLECTEQLPQRPDGADQQGVEPRVFE